MRSKSRLTPSSNWPRIPALWALLIISLLSLAGCLEPTSQHPSLPALDLDPDPVVEEPEEDDEVIPEPGVKFISAGGFHTCAAKHANKSLYCWGAGDKGQIGNSSTSNIGLPTRVGIMRDWEAIASGLRHNCGIRAIELSEMKTNDLGELERVVTGTENRLWCWGDNQYNQTGQADTISDDKPDKLSVHGPSPVSTQLIGWTDVTAGGHHSCAIQEDEETRDRALYCWGGNKHRQTGDPSTELIIFTPEKVGAELDWLQVSAGENHTCGIREDKLDSSDTETHTLWCWGSNTFSQLGKSGLFNTAAPHEVQENTAWLKVSAGNRHTCATQQDNTLWCWGDSTYGQLGQGNTTREEAPIQVGSDSDWVDVSASGLHTCAVKENGSLWCWGNNLYGQLGLSEVGHQLSPTQVTSSLEFTAVVSGEYHTCALDKQNTSHCWGYNAQGQLGVEALPDIISVAKYNNANWKQIASGEDYTCGIKSSDDTLWCGGINGLGQLGDKTPINRAKAVLADTDDTTYETWSEVTVGSDHACAISDYDDSLWCWGSNDKYQLGNADHNDNNAQNWRPAQINATDQWQKVSSGPDHTCALKQEAAGVSAWCWGDNSFGQLSNDPASAADAVEVEIDGTSESDWVDIAAGGNHTCGIRETSIFPLRRELYCWGRNHQGQLAQDLDTVETSATPVRVGTDSDWEDITAGQNHTCGIRQPSTSPLERIVICWGENASSQTPEPDTTLDPATGEPRQTKASLRQVLEDTDWISIEAGPNHTCGLRQSSSTESSLYCWGDNSSKQIRQRSTFSLTVDTPSLKDTREWGNYSLGKNHTCAIATEEGEPKLFCWGEAAPYQLGDGSGWKFTPQELLF